MTDRFMDAADDIMNYEISNIFTDIFGRNSQMMQNEQDYKPLRYVCTGFLFGIAGGGILSGPFFLCDSPSWGLAMWSLGGIATFIAVLVMLMMRH